jgi:hypothetical protein
MRCRGLHCDGCSHHGGAGLGAGFGALLLLGGVLVYAGHRHAIDHAADVAAHVALTVLTVAAISIGALAAAGVGVVVTRAVVAAREHRRAIAPPRVTVLPARSQAQAPRAVEAPARQGRVWPLRGWPEAIGWQAGGRRDDDS